MLMLTRSENSVVFDVRGGSRPGGRVLCDGGPFVIVRMLSESGGISVRMKELDEVEQLRNLLDLALKKAKAAEAELADQQAQETQRNA